MTNVRAGFSRGRTSAPAKDLPRELVDRLILSSLADRVLTLTRVRTRLEGLRKGLKRSQSDQEGNFKQLTMEVERLQQSSKQL